jgi:hypothetical protein
MKLLQTLFDITCEIDKRLLRTLFDAAEALTRCKKLSITSLGRSRMRTAMVKHNIKCIDRFFVNKSLHNKSDVFYREIERWVGILLGELEILLTIEKLIVQFESRLKNYAVPTV